MSDTPPARGPSRLLSSLLLLVLAAAGALALERLLAPGAVEAATDVLTRVRAGDVVAAWSAALASGVLPWLVAPVAGPLLVALILALAGGARGGSGSAPAGAREAKRAAGPAAAPRAAAEAEPGAVGLRLLAALQEDARLLDFVREDMDAYSDEQIGSAARGIHAALRKAIDARVAIAPILPGEDGDSVEVPAGFDPAQVRLIGNPAGRPPFRGVLRHGGWKASAAQLPLPTAGSDPTILMPAEVEVG